MNVVDISVPQSQTHTHAQACDQATLMHVVRKAWWQYLFLVQLEEWMSGIRNN